MNMFDEAEAMAREVHAQFAMRIKAKQDEFHDFLDGLDNETLALLGNFVTVLAHGEAYEGTYWQGLIEQKLRTRGVCQGCGRDHAQAFLDEQHEPLKAEVKTASTSGESEEAWTQPTFEDVADLQAEGEGTIRQNASLWGVAFVDYDNLKGPVICLNCKTSYPNLEDRMRRAPGVEGCGTCQQRAMWG